MTNEIELISDGDGLAVIGEPSAVERFLVAEGLVSRNLELPRLGSVFGTAAGIAQAGSEISANSGRWVKLTKESAEAMKKFDLMKGSATGVSRAIVTENGKITGILQFVTKPAVLLANPAFLAGAAGIMSQVAMQQAMDDITDYLATIDAKLDDVLRAQKDAVLADMIGVDFVIDEATIIRGQVGRVSEVTWSKVQGTSVTIARTQAYALRQLDALAEKMENRGKLADLAETCKVAETKAAEWLVVLARCFQLQDALAVLELDRVMDASPSELDQHRLAVRAARQNRLELISRSTEKLLGRLDMAAARANSNVLLHPNSARSVVNSTNHVTSGVTNFHGSLGITGSRESLEAKRWTVAAADARDTAFHSGADGVDAVKDFGVDTFNRARSMTDRLAIKIAEGARLRQVNSEERDTAGDDIGETRANHEPYDGAR